MSNGSMRCKGKEIGRRATFHAIPWPISPSQRLPPFSLAPCGSQQLMDRRNPRVEQPAQREGT